MAKEVQAVLQRNISRISKCLDSLAGQAGAPSEVVATVTVSAANGRITEVLLKPSVSADACLRRQLQSLSFKHRPSKNFKLKIPLNIQVL